jgi:hypothetical protein
VIVSIADSAAAIELKWRNTTSVSICGSRLGGALPQHCHVYRG